ncbi:MAG: hypothetical protein IRZ29_07825, partial [Thermoflavifilum sp.]|nr:hypothetical protein [Thermoflavifilum sp.]
MTGFLHLPFLFTLASKAWHIVWTRKRETRLARRHLYNIEKQNGGKFPADLFQKIAVSYGIYVPVVVEGFCKLHARKLLPIEKKRFMYYFICSSLFDYFVDEVHMPFDKMQHLAFYPESTLPASFEETVFLEAHQWLLQQVNDREGYIHCSKELFLAQQQSALQFQKNIPASAVLDITFRKGGYAVQLGSYYIEDEVPQIERQIWFQLGVLIQLINDLFDVWKDAPQEIRSSVLAVQDIRRYAEIFEHQVEILWQFIEQHPAAPITKQDFLFHIAGTLSFGYIAIHQLSQLQGGKPHLPPYAIAHRKDWII